MKNKIFFIIILVLAILASIVIWQMLADKAPRPAYTVVKKEGSIEIRQYPSLILAQVSQGGERNPAIQQGFTVLADYIFGNNQSKNTIQMTAPVMQQSETITMTAPVTQQQQEGSWLVSFVMPEKYTLKTLPTPVNNKIQIVKVPEKKYVVIQFSGFNSASNLKSHLKKLQNYIKKNQLKTKGNAILAFYNPPWTLPFLRHNEIMFELRQ